MPNWLDKLMGIPVEENPVDKAIIEKLPDGENKPCGRCGGPHGPGLPKSFCPPPNEVSFTYSTLSARLQSGARCSFWVKEKEDGT